MKWFKINWKLAVDWKICDADNNCLGECAGWKVWDTNTNSCVVPASTPELAWETCKTIIEENPWTSDWYYYIKPVWYAWTAFKVYCDMTTFGWWWTLVIRWKWQSHISEYAWNIWSMLSYNQTNPNGETFKFSDYNINLLSTEAYKVVADGRKSCTVYYSSSCNYTSNTSPTSGSICLKSYSDVWLTSWLRTWRYYWRSWLSNRMWSQNSWVVTSNYPEWWTWGAWWNMQAACSSNSWYGRTCNWNSANCNFTVWVK